MTQEQITIMESILKIWRVRTNTNINLADSDSIGNHVHGSETRGALTVHSLEGRGVRNTSVEGSHTSSSGTSASREDVANAYVFDVLWVEADRRVDGLEHGGKHLFWMGILKSTLASL